MNVKKGSFLDQLYMFRPSNWVLKENVDICSYVWGIIRGIFLVLLSIMMGVLTSLLLLEFPIVFVLSYLYGIGPEMGGFFFGVSGKDGIGLFLASATAYILVGTVAGIIFVGVCFEALIKTSKGYLFKGDTKPSVANLYYKSLKEKTCFLIKRV